MTFSASHRLRPVLRHLALAAGCLPLVAACQPNVVRIEGPTMGSKYHITWVADRGTPDPKAVQAAIQTRLNELDLAISTYRDDSALSRFNAAPAGTCQTMPTMALELARAAQKLAADSDGAFDVTLMPVLDYWKFGPKAARARAALEKNQRHDGLTVAQLLAQDAPSGKDVPASKDGHAPASGAASEAGSAPAATTHDKTIRALADTPELAALRAQTGMQHLRIEGERLCKDAPITLEFNSIAAGYIIDRIAADFAAQGIRNYLVEVTGEIRAGGHKPGNIPWRIAIEAPVDDQVQAERFIELRDTAISTSGDYRNYREENGRRYSHLIDPRTMAPITHHLAAATVVTDSAQDADGLSTLLMVLGPDKGHDYAVRHDLAAVLVTRTADGFVPRTTPAFDRRFPVFSKK